MEIRVLKTIRGKEPMSESQGLCVHNNPDEESTLICIFPDIEYQKINGFGGAFTEAAAETFNKLSQANKEKIVRLYFNPEDGIGYNFGRVHINSCDFSLGNYTYVKEGDETLETFDVTRDEKAIIPMIKGAQKHNDISFFASPWSPPAYMKTNNMMNQGGKLKEEYFDLWASYYVKFIKEYEKRGIKIDMISVQNEPKAVQTWDSCIYSAKEEGDFVINHLGKKMKDIGVKILFWDHNKERIIERAIGTLNNKNATDYIDGIAFHWYSGDHFEQLEMFNRLYPDKDIVFSEGCYEHNRGKIDDFEIGEKYAHDMIGNFNNFCSAFCDWNLILDENGGPNHVGNFCDAPIMADTGKDEVIVHSSYYCIGHFSKFVKKGAKRIGSSKWTSDLDTVSFKNPDGSIVTIVLNRTDRDMDFIFRMNEKMHKATAEAHSITTYIFND